MKNKGLILLIISIILLNYKIIEDKNNIIYHNQIIDKIKDNHNEYKEYYGYIEIPKYNIKRLIKEGTNNYILDSNYVGKMTIKNKNLILLAGHNINLVFHKIHYLNKNDLVYLNNVEYKVISFKEIKVNDYSILKDYDKETLILMTCTSNQNKRYIVICEVNK